MSSRFPSTLHEIRSDPTQAWLLEMGTSDEAAIVEELKRMPIEAVPVGSSDWLYDLGMRERDCHQNCQHAVGLHQQGQCRQVLGWMVVNGVYLVHSVVDLGTERLCVTPNPHSDEKAILFIADSSIDERSSGDVTEFYRKGIKLNYGVREDPAYVARTIEMEVNWSGLTKLS